MIMDGAKRRRGSNYWPCLGYAFRFGPVFVGLVWLLCSAVTMYYSGPLQTRFGAIRLWSVILYKPSRHILKEELLLDESEEIELKNKNSSTISPSLSVDSLADLQYLANESNFRKEPYHDFDMFKVNFKEMGQHFKIFVYPYSHKNPFWSVFLPMNDAPHGNYASESYFKKALMGSHFMTTNASEANMFYLPFSIAKLRYDKRVGGQGLREFISSYITTIRHKWPYWNRTSGADHFFVSCHSITKLVSEIVYLRVNLIQVVCSSNNFVNGYAPHKDVAIPQVWPRKKIYFGANLKQRKVLGFFAGAANSPVRASVVKAWSGDHDIRVYSKRVSTSYSEALLTSKFCLHVKGYEVNTARIADAVFYGCVPAILANHYDLPFGDVLNWEQFSVIISITDIPLLKTVLEALLSTEYERLQKNVMQIRQHFIWNFPPVEYDAFYMVMYELWLRSRLLRPTF